MPTQEELMQRLAVSKKIMEKHGEIKRGDARPETPILEDYNTPSSNYNIPSEFLQEENNRRQDFDPSTPLDENKILNSKLPDEIKRLMIEQPIVQPNSMTGGVTLSDDVIEGATRLMKKDKLPETKINNNTQQLNKPNTTQSNFNITEIKSIIRDVVRDTVRDVVREELKDAGMLVESTTDTNEMIQFKVGQHLFIGRVTKIKKLEK
jgi:hypothetical protein